MGAGGGDLEPGAFRGGDQFAARAMHLDAQVGDAVADFRAGLDDRLVHLVLDLLDDVGRSGRDQLHDVRAQLACRRIDDLEFFFDADREAVSHGVALRSGLGLRGTRERRYHTPLTYKITSERDEYKAVTFCGRESAWTCEERHGQRRGCEQQIGDNARCPRRSYDAAN